MYSSNIKPDIRLIIGSDIVSINPVDKTRTVRGKLAPGLVWLEIKHCKLAEHHPALTIVGSIGDGHHYFYVIGGSSDNPADEDRGIREIYDLVPDHDLIAGQRLDLALIGRRCLIGFGQHPADGGMLVRQIETGSLSIFAVDHNQGGVSP